MELRSIGFLTILGQSIKPMPQQKMNLPFQSTGTRNYGESLLSCRDCQMVLIFLYQSFPRGVVEVNFKLDNIIKRQQIINRNRQQKRHMRNNKQKRSVSPINKKSTKTIKLKQNKKVEGVRESSDLLQKVLCPNCLYNFTIVKENELKYFQKKYLKQQKQQQKCRTRPLEINESFSLAIIGQVNIQKQVQEMKEYLNKQTEKKFFQSNFFLNKCQSQPLQNQELSPSEVQFFNMKLEYEALLSKYHESLIKTAIDKDYFEKCIKNIVSECEHQELPSFLKAVTIQYSHFQECNNSLSRFLRNIEQ